MCQYLDFYLMDSKDIELILNWFKYIVSKNWKNNEQWLFLVYLHVI